MDAPVFLAPVETPVQLLTTNVTVRSADVGQIARMMTVAAPVVQTLVDLPPDMLDRLHSEQGPTVEDLLDLMGVLAKQPDKLFELVAIATRLPLDFVQALPPDQFAYLFAVVVKTNADFFYQATPAFSAAGRVLKQLRQQALTGSGPGPLTA